MGITAPVLRAALQWGAREQHREAVVRCQVTSRPRPVVSSGHVPHRHLATAGTFLTVTTGVRGPLLLTLGRWMVKSATGMGQPSQAGSDLLKRSEV